MRSYVVHFLNPVTDLSLPMTHTKDREELLLVHERMDISKVSTGCEHTTSALQCSTTIPYVIWELDYPIFRFLKIELCLFIAGMADFESHG
jgi:hypothetical protein